MTDKQSETERKGKMLYSPNTNNESPNTLVNICGLGRSGTTMLDLMLGNAPDAFSCGEVHAWFRPHRTHHFRIDCACGNDPCHVWDLLKDLKEDEFYLNIFNKLCVKFAIDSSKNLCWLIKVNERAVKNNIRVYNLFIWKEPIDMAYSRWKRNYSIESSITEFVKYSERLFAAGIPFYSVSYRDLVCNPQHKLKEICNVIGMPYFSGKERFWEQQHHHLFGSAGTRKQVKERYSDIKVIANYPDDFQLYFKAIADQISFDIKLQGVLSILRQNEISLIREKDVTARKFKPKRLYPLWYYIQRMKTMIRRYHPQSINIDN